MKSPLIKLAVIFFGACMVAVAASASASSASASASFANPAAEKAFSSHGNLSVRTSDAALVAMISQNGTAPSNQYRSSGCSYGCSTGCSTGCSYGCSSGCSSGCSYGCRY